MSRRKVIAINANCRRGEEKDYTQRELLNMSNNVERVDVSEKYDDKLYVLLINTFNGYYYKSIKFKTSKDRDKYSNVFKMALKLNEKV